MFRHLGLQNVQETPDEVEKLRYHWFPIASFCHDMGRNYMGLRRQELEFLYDLIQSDYRASLSIKQANWLLRLFSKVMPRNERARDQYVKDRWWDYCHDYDIEWAPWGFPSPPTPRFDDDLPIPAPDLTNVIDFRRHLLAKRLLANCS